MAGIRDNVDQWRDSVGDSRRNPWPKRLGVILAVAVAGVAMLAASGALGIPGCQGERSTSTRIFDQAQPKDKPKDKPATETPAKPEFEKVPIAGREFKLELVLDDQHRIRGLSDRTEIPADGGMLFVFPRAQRMSFVMRDCPIPIDVIFLDATGRITAFHKMEPETPRTDDEKKLTPLRPGDPEWSWTNAKYEARLKHYDSKFSAQFGIELKGGTLDELKLKEGDQIKLDIAGLKKRAE